MASDKGNVTQSMYEILDFPLFEYSLRSIACVNRLKQEGNEDWMEVSGV